MTPKKKSVVKSDAVAAVSPAVESILAKVVRKRSASVSKTVATEAPAAAAEEKKTRSKKSVVAVEAAVTHRHKKQEFAPSMEIAAAVQAPAAPAVAPSHVSKQPYEPSHEEAAKLAYSYYVARGYQPGDSNADWFRAVQELKARHAAATSLLED